MTEALFIQYVYNAGIHEVYTLLQSTQLDFHHCTDARGLTALHISTLNGNTLLVKFLLEYSKFYYKSPEILKSWVNFSSDEGFSALHYSAFQGNLVNNIQEILKCLLSCGADLSAKNHQGLSVMHVAAQGDQALILVYLYSLDLPLDSLDNKACLPLHWACYTGCETSASVLLSWGGEINAQDEDGRTPLHLATLAGNSRIVRNLLVKGADRKITVREM